MIPNRADNSFRLCDTHVHCCFSADSEARPEEIAEEAIRRGIDTICFTDHMDYDFADAGDTFTFDLSEYFQKMTALKEQYSGRIRILAGMEFGLQTHLAARFKEISEKWRLSSRTTATINDLITKLKL